MKNVDFDLFRNSLLVWYDKHARVLPWRDNPSPYRVWISEIMLQQTRVDTVKPYFERFLTELPTIKDLAEVSDERLMKLWEGLGYYSRARNLKKAAIQIVEEYDGELPANIEELMKLSGIGPYTSGAIGSIAFGLRGTAVDGNVYRVIARLTANQNDLSERSAKKEIEDLVLALLPEDRVGDFNQGLMELGATVCLPNGQPKCEECPVRELCEAKELGIEMTLPVKVKKKARRVEEKTIFVIEYNDRIAIRQRPMEGLLNGLWEFPNLDGLFDEEECEDIMKNWGIRFSRIIPLGKAKHIFSHIEWQMVGYFVKADWMQSRIREDSESGIREEGESAVQEEGEAGEFRIQEEGESGEFRIQEEGVLVFQEESEIDVFGRIEEQGELVFATKEEIKKKYSIPTAFSAYRDVIKNAGM